MMDFSGSAGAASAFDTIPNGQHAWAILQVKGVKSSASGGGYLDVELTIDQGQPFAGRKVFEMIGDPQNPGNSEKYREMGTIAITRILEAGRGAGPNNPAGYKIGNYQDLSGLRVPVKLKIEAGTNGHQDKNKVAEWLTPNPASQSGHKGFLQLQSGVYNTATTTTTGTAQAGFGGFGGGQAQTQPAAQAGFGNTGGTAQQGGGFGNGGGQAATSGFGQPQSGNVQTAEHQNGATTGFAQTNGATTQSPSDPAATPGWLAQAGQ